MLGLREHIVRRDLFDGIACGKKLEIARKGRGITTDIDEVDRTNKFVQSVDDFGRNTFARRVENDVHGGGDIQFVKQFRQEDGGVAVEVGDAVFQSVFFSEDVTVGGGFGHDLYIVYARAAFGERRTQDAYAGIGVDDDPAVGDAIRDRGIDKVAHVVVQLQERKGIQADLDAEDVDRKRSLLYGNDRLAHNDVVTFGFGRVIKRVPLA